MNFREIVNKEKSETVSTPEPQEQQENSLDLTSGFTKVLQERTQKKELEAAYEHQLAETVFKIEQYLMTLNRDLGTSEKILIEKIQELKTSNSTVSETIQSMSGRLLNTVKANQDKLLKDFDTQTTAIRQNFERSIDTTFRNYETRVSNRLNVQWGIGILLILNLVIELVKLIKGW